MGKLKNTITKVRLVIPNEELVEAAIFAFNGLQQQPLGNSSINLSGSSQ